MLSKKVIQGSPQIRKNLFASKKKKALVTKENFWEVSPSKSTPKYQLLGKAREDLVLTPLTIRSANTSRASERRSLLHGKPDEADESIAPLQTKDFNTSVQVDVTQSEEDWYEGKTLLEKLAERRHKRNNPEDNSRKLGVVEDLTGAFDKLDIRLQEELTAPIVEALDHVSKTHAVMEGTADQDMRRGLESFDGASQGAYELRCKIRKHLKQSLDENQKTLKSLFQSLKTAYQKREMLWEELAESFEKCADQALASFTTLDESIKRTETLLDKRCRVLNHESSSKGKGKKDVLKSFLEKM